MGARLTSGRHISGHRVSKNDSPKHHFVPWPVHLCLLPWAENKAAAAIRPASKILRPMGAAAARCWSLLELLLKLRASKVVSARAIRMAVHFRQSAVHKCRRSPLPSALALVGVEASPARRVRELFALDSTYIKTYRLNSCWFIPVLMDWGILGGKVCKYVTCTCTCAKRI